MKRPIPARYGPKVIDQDIARHRIMGDRIVIGDKQRAREAREKRKKKGWKV